jgi:serine/threonine protein kinase
MDHLGDGTFGRTLLCQKIGEASEDERSNYAVKIIRCVRRYNQSAQYEVSILKDIVKRGGTSEHLVHLYEQFEHEDPQGKRHMCLVFETLGKSLYEFVKANKYYGFALRNIQSIGRQILQGVCFLHEKIGLTHTDLKPENILLKMDTRKWCQDEKRHPINVQHKSTMYDGTKVEEWSDESEEDDVTSEVQDGGTGGKQQARAQK